MDIASGLLAFVLAALLVLQGSSLVRQKAPACNLGVLNFGLAALGLVGFVSIRSGTMIFGPELGVLLVEGYWGRLALSVLLLGVPAAAGLALSVARGETSPVPLRSYLVTGAAIGVAASFFVTKLNPADPAPLTVYEYDLWWTPVVWWMATCALGSVLGLCGVRQRRWWVILDLALSSALAAVAISDTRLHPIFASSTTRPLWIVCLIATFVPLLAVIAESVPVPWRVLDGSIARAIKVVLVAAAALASCLAWVWKQSPRYLIALSILFGAICAVVLVRGAAARFGKWREDGYLIPDFGRKGRTDDIVLTAAVLGMAGGIADLLDFNLLPASWSLTVVVAAWLTVVEILAREGDEPAPSHLLRKSVDVGKGMWRGLSAVPGKVQQFFQSEHWHVATMKTLFSVLAGVLLLVVCAEIPNRGKTTIMPFSVTVSKDLSAAKEQSAKNEDVEKKLAQLVPDRILNALGLLRSELRTDLITLSSYGGDDKSTRQFATTRETPAGWDTALAKSSDLKLGGVEVPVSVLAAPVQGIARNFLGERVVFGGFYAEQKGFTLHAGSSTGEYWRVSLPSVDHRHGAKEPEPDASTPVDAATKLAEQVAFQMISGDPAMISAGMTARWSAFEHFRTGLQDWEQYEAGDPNAVTYAIEHFKQAIHEDGNFALAHYRLGRAYGENGQPSLAINQLRKSIEVRPDFVPGFDALANALYEQASQDKRQRRVEAKELWQRMLLLPPAVLSPADVSSAYYGLCRTAIDEEKNDLGYFFCKRAERTLENLPEALQRGARIRQSRAFILTNLGIALDWKSNDVSEGTTDDWQCYPAHVQAVEVRDGVSVTKHQNPSSRYGPDALRYYRAALGLEPDDMVLRCNAATTLAALGNNAMMEELNGDARAHLTAAEVFRWWLDNNGVPEGVKDHQVYRLALQEYDKAIELAPFNLDALHGYAYTFWSWRKRAARGGSAEGPDAEVAQKAETYARQLVRLANGNVPRAAEIAYRSTLGEVLLGQGRAHEAREVLEAALGDHRNEPAFNEAEWDLAQACLCERSTDESARLDTKDGEKLLEEAIGLLRVLRSRAEGLERPEFSGVPESLDGDYALPVCLRSQAAMLERSPAKDLPRYDVAVRYEARSPCDWTVVVASVQDAGGQRVGTVPDKHGKGVKYRLHVWGGGVEATGDADAQMRAQVFLRGEPKRTRLVYFAQLEDVNGVPRSAVQPVETFEKAEQCARNQIALTFTPAQPNR